jgi:hypothetical protein
LKEFKLALQFLLTRDNLTAKFPLDGDFYLYYQKEEGIIKEEEV